MQTIPDRVAHRAISRYYFESPTGCHISTYSTGSHGYAQVGWSETDTRVRMVLAHRAAWTAVYGPIPSGMTVDHMCKSRRCVNILHLRLLSNFENARRTLGRDWPVGTCINGHPNSEIRSYSQGPGRRRKRACKMCRADIQRAARARAKDAA